MRTCGWCGHPTATDPCSSCGHIDPDRPWIQRGQVPPVVDDAERHRRLLAEARDTLRREGVEPTIERLAEQLDVSPRTVRRWRGDVRSAA